MTPIVRITALTVFALTFTLLALGCSNKSSDDSAADSGEIRIVDGEILLIKSATHDMDTTLNVVADRVEYRQPAVAFVVSWDSDPALHAIVAENVGKRLRVRLSEGDEIVAAEELSGKKRIFITVDSTESSVDASENQRTVESVENVVEEPPEGWNFLLGSCVVKHQGNPQLCNEEAARSGQGAGAYDIFGDRRIDMYIFDPASMPIEFKKDFHLVADDISYEYDAESSGVLVTIRTPEGCSLRSQYTANEDRTMVDIKTLDLEGSCTDIQKNINEAQRRLGPSSFPLKCGNGGPICVR